MSGQIPKLNRALCAAYELIENPVWVFDPHRLRKVWANQSALKVWNSPSLEELCSRDFGIDISPGTRQRLQKMVEATQNGSRIQEQRTFHPRGTTPQTMECSMVGVEFEGVGFCMLIHAKPIHRDQQTSDSLRTLEAIHLSPTAMGLFDTSGQVVVENTASVILFEQPHQTNIPLLQRFCCQKTARKIQQELVHKGLVRAEVQLSTAQGPLWMWFHAQYITDPVTSEPCILVNQVDIHKWKLAQLALTEAKKTAEQASKSKSEFLANMSHEIRTPMNGVLGMTELLQLTELSPRQKKYAGTIRRSAETLLQIINDILDFSRIEAGKLDLESIDFDLHRLIDDILELLRTNASKKGIELLCTIPANTPNALVGDPVRVKQVLLNLVSNAIKFTERGKVTISLQAIEEGRTETMLHFEVRDTGIGLNEEAKKRVFNSFEQADGSTTRKFGGTGLGLAITKQLVHLMGGEIGVESTLGVGSTFWFTLRLGLQGEAYTYDIIPASDLAGVPVLVVDDNPINRTVLAEQIHSWGGLASLAESAVQALSHLEEAMANEKPFKLLLVDREMPEVDGISLLQTLSRDLRYDSLARVMLSSGPEAPPEAERNELRLDAHLTKPVRHKHLFECLTRVLGETIAIEVDEGELGSDVVLIGKRVLLVEDNYINQEVALGMLETLGCEVTVAEHGGEAVEFYQQQRFDLILMDCQMPVMDGYAATEALRKLESEKSQEHTPIIALTANAMKGDRERCINAGMDDFLSKPFEQSALSATLQNWVYEPESC